MQVADFNFFNVQDNNPPCCANNAAPGLTLPPLAKQQAAFSGKRRRIKHRPKYSEPVNTAVQRPAWGEFSAMLCSKASLDLLVRLRFAPRLTKNSLKI
jgi:hypothetical protein